MRNVLKMSFLGFVLSFYVSTALTQETEAQSIPSELTSADSFYGLIDSTVVVPLIDFRNTKIVDILTTISKQYNLNMWIDPGIDGLATIRLENSRLDEVIKFFIEEYELQFEKTGSFLKVSRTLIPSPAKIVLCQDDLLTLNIEGLEIEELIRLLTDNCGINIVKDPGVTGKISGYMKDVEPEVGLRAVLNSNGFDLLKQEGLYVISSMDSSPTGKRILSGVTVRDGRISLNVVNAGLRGLIDNIVDKTGLQVVIYGSIEGSVTAKCTNLTPDRAFDYILRGTKYTYSVEDSVYFIGSASIGEITVTRLIRLKHLIADGVIDLLPDKITTQLVIKLIKEHNGLMAMGPLQVVNDLEKYIAEIDYPPPQILIEALVVDYIYTDRLEYGIKAAGFPFGDSTSAGQVYYPGIDVTGSSEELNRDLEYWADKFNISNIGKLPSDFFVRLNALAQEGKANIRSRPRIATLNGHEAKIDVGTTQYYLLKTETTYGIGQDTPSTQISEKFHTIEASMSLTITPWVNESKEIIVRIHPEFNTPQGSFDSKVPPTINHRILDSIVRLRDGETIILGGLIQTTETENIDKFPILGDIPILGWFFKNRSKIKTNSELVIYLTPHIYYGSEGAVDISEYE